MGGVTTGAAALANRTVVPLVLGDVVEDGAGAMIDDERVACGDVVLPGAPGSAEEAGAGTVVADEDTVGSTGWADAWLEPPAVIAPAVRPPAARIPKNHGVSGCMPSSFRREGCAISITCGR